LWLLVGKPDKDDYHLQPVFSADEVQKIINNEIKKIPTKFFGPSLDWTIKEEKFILLCLEQYVDKTKDDIFRDIATELNLRGDDYPFRTWKAVKRRVEKLKGGANNEGI